MPGASSGFSAKYVAPPDASAIAVRRSSSKPPPNPIVVVDAWCLVPDAIETS
jgi:hypothetical protein